MLEVESGRLINLYDWRLKIRHFNEEAVAIKKATGEHNEDFHFQIFE